MKFVNEFGIAPTRGTAKSVGLDFYMPNPRVWGEKQLSAFLEYLRLKKLDTLAAYIENASDKNDEAAYVLLYISHQYVYKPDYEQWKDAAICSAFSDADKNANGICVEPGESILVPTGIRTMFAPNTYGEFENKSGMGSKGWQVGAKVIDEDYTGYVHLNLHNVSNHDNEIILGQKLSQLIERPVVTYDDPTEISPEAYFEYMSDTTRGDGAFGHTGA